MDNNDDSLMTTSEQSPSADSKCDNCGEELLGAFCWVCGQKDSHYNRSLFKIIGDFFKEMFDVDSRVFTTLSTLFLRPGKLSIQFRDNKRASYVTPIRLYLFSSLVFFFLFALTTRIQNVQVDEESSADGAGNSQMETSQLGDRAPVRTQKEVDEYLSSIRSLVRIEEGVFESAKNVLKRRIVYLEHDQWREEIFDIVDQMRKDVGFRNYDSQLEEAIRSAEEAHKRMRVVRDFFKEAGEGETRGKGEEIVQSRAQGQLLNVTKVTLSWIYTHQYENDEFNDARNYWKPVLKAFIHASHDGRDFVDDVTENLPLMMFVLLPIFVSMLSFLSLGKGIRVVFQLIYAMHIHALAFITLTIEVLMSLVFSNIPYLNSPYVLQIMALLLTLFIIVHIYLSFKNFYGSGHIVSLLKFTVLTIAYGMVLVVSLLAMMIYFIGVSLI
ncbi:MAG: DUF3667 domain-containing protein [Gammaproteobacteria bacterium]|nr:DUF3667 domain-containing protein [Gammaproteobacteria bacterium]